jgi:hypothetical protein
MPSDPTPTRPIPPPAAIKAVEALIEAHAAIYNARTKVGDPCPETPAAHPEG